MHLARCAARAYTDDLLARWRVRAFAWDSLYFAFLAGVSFRLRVERAMDVVLGDCSCSRRGATCAVNGADIHAPLK